MFRAKLITAGVVGAGLAVGCTNLPKLPSLADSADTRAQVADDAAESDPNATVGQRTAVGNVEPIPVHGVGLVYKLHGTGSSPQPDQWRATLENAIRKAKGNPRELLDDPDRTSSLVLVSAIIPAGARQGDKLDVTVALPPGSKTTSLKHGVLYATDLQNMELADNARQALQAAGIPTGKVPLVQEGTILPGHRMAVAEGPLVAGYEGPTQPGPAEDEDGNPSKPKANPDGPARPASGAGPGTSSTGRTTSCSTTTRRNRGWRWSSPSGSTPPSTPPATASARSPRPRSRASRWSCPSSRRRTGTTTTGSCSSPGRCRSTR